MEIKRFAFDLGTNSIGWAVLAGQRTEEGKTGSATTIIGTTAVGVRVFSDGRNPKYGSSLAMMRRGPRAARRRRDRFLQRQRKLIYLLIEHGLMPKAEGERKRLERLDPYALRAKALDHRIELHELGRVIFHLNQRRGFQSNRKADAKADDKGVLKQAQQRLDDALRQQGARTLGEFLFARLGKGDHARFRQTGTGPKAEHEFYPSRKMVYDEFAAIWDAQANYHPQSLTNEARLKIENCLFYQRPLKPVKAGKCTFNPTEERMAAAYPSVEARRIYQEVNELRYGTGLDIKTPLDRAQRDAVASALLMGEAITWDKLRKKVLKLDANIRFSLEESRADGLEGCATAKKLKGNKKRPLFGAMWDAFQLERKDEIVRRLLETEDTDELVAWLSTECSLPAETAEAVASTNLPDGHGRLGPSANAAILAQLRDHHDYTYAKAAGYHHSDFSTEEKLSSLPYYAKVLERHVAFGSNDPADPEEKRYGKFANPTVHIALNQLRRLVNQLITKYGKPDEIVIELARELKQSKKQKDEERQKNRKNEEANKARRAELERLRVPDNAGNMLRLRLWEEQRDGLQSFCPYSGVQISLQQLFSSEVEVDHILPFSRTLDDSASNKIVCFTSSNRGKKNQTPFEFFSTQSLWPAIEANAQKLPRNKRWRFAADAMEKFKTENRDFLDRQLNETRHLARVAKTYLDFISPQVWVVTGSLTALLRGKWGLNSILSDDNRKNRDDHRHHAIDAFVIGNISRSMLNELSRRAALAEDRQDARIIADVPEPFDGCRDQLRELVRAMIVSHKAEHGKQGALHKKTAYGLVKNERERAIGNVVYRKALENLSENDIDRVRDVFLRTQLQRVRDRVRSGEAKADQKKLAAALREYANCEAQKDAAKPGKPRAPIRHVRVLKPEAANVEIAFRKSGSPYKAVVPGENWCMDVVSVPDGKGGYVWKGFAASIFEVNQKGWRPEWERQKIGGKLIMRLHKNDLVEIDDKDGMRRVKRVVSINPSAKRFYLAGNCEAGSLQDRHDDGSDPFRWDLASVGSFQGRKARKVKVDFTGQLIPSVG
jgi:CRISPR-associated endonuclease Csn1